MNLRSSIRPGTDFVRHCQAATSPGWKHADGQVYEDFFTSSNTNTEWRYIARIYPDLGKIRFGFDKSGPISYRADDPKIWSGIPEELQARLRTAL